MLEMLAPTEVTALDFELPPVIVMELTSGGERGSWRDWIRMIRLRAIGSTMGESWR